MARIISNGIDFSGTNLITPECYSTEERVIGCWVNGKPLYQRTYEGGTIPASSNLDIPIDVTNVDEIFISKAVTYSTTQGFSLILNDVIPTYAQHSKRIYLSKSASKIVIDNGDTDNFYDKTYVTVIYTKTTDTAGSGIWTPQGLPAVHYSEQEHIVGTWIDGSTLYEKTIEVNSDGNNAWTQVFNDQTADIVSFEGYVLYANGEYGSANYYAANNAYCRSLVYDSRHRLQVYPVNSVTASSKIYMTIRYTKSA